MSRADLRTLLRRERAASALSYGLVVGLVAVLSIGAVQSVGDSVTALFGGVAEDLGRTGQSNPDAGDEDSPQPNQAPDAPTLSATQIEENTGAGASIGTLSASDPDAGQTVSFSLGSAGGDEASFQIVGTDLQATQDFDFESPADTGGTAGDNVYVVEVIATDDGSPAASSVALLQVTVTDANDAPVAANDPASGTEPAFTTDEDTLFTMGDALANDTDPDTRDTLSVTSMDASGTTGLVTDNGDGTFTYDPNGQFESLSNGDTSTDSFNYTITDGTDTDSATVTITINGVNDAPSVALGSVNPVEAGSGVQTVSGFATFIPGGGELGQSVEQWIVSEASDPNGAVSEVSIAANGDLSYSPDAAGTAIINVQVQDDGGTANGGIDTSSTQQFNITVNPIPAAGIGFCSDSTPSTGEEGCDPGDGTIFVSQFNADLSGGDERLYVAAFDLQDDGSLMDDAVTDRGRIAYRDDEPSDPSSGDTRLPPLATNTLDCPRGSATSSACQDGLAMTANLLADTGSNFPAANLCDSLVAAGHSDWYLPSRNEWDEIYSNLIQNDTDSNSDGVGDLFNFGQNGIFPQSFYWPSSSEPQWGAGFLILTQGGSWREGQSKRNRASVRCMRRD